MKRTILSSVFYSLIFVMLVTSSKCSDSDSMSAPKGKVPNVALEEESEEPLEDPLPQEFLDIGAKELPIADESDTSPILEKLNEVDRSQLNALIEATDKAVPYTQENQELDDLFDKDIGEWLTPESNEPAVEGQ